MREQDSCGQLRCARAAREGSRSRGPGPGAAAGGPAAVPPAERVPAGEGAAVAGEPRGRLGGPVAPRIHRCQHKMPHLGSFEMSKFLGPAFVRFH